VEIDVDRGAQTRPVRADAPCLHGWHA
jgi:hypothetical protein